MTHGVVVMYRIFGRPDIWPNIRPGQYQVSGRISGHGKSCLPYCGNASNDTSFMHSSLQKWLLKVSQKILQKEKVLLGNESVTLNINVMAGSCQAMQSPTEFSITGYGLYCNAKSIFSAIHVH